MSDYHDLEREVLALTNKLKGLGYFLTFKDFIDSTDVDIKKGKSYGQAVSYNEYVKSRAFIGASIGGAISGGYSLIGSIVGGGVSEDAAKKEYRRNKKVNKKVRERGKKYNRQNKKKHFNGRTL